MLIHIRARMKRAQNLKHLREAVKKSPGKITIASNAFAHPQCTS
jgi:hypothetical protein